MNTTGTIMGYDPGGNQNHGVAFFTYEKGKLVNHQIHTLDTAHDVIELTKTKYIFAIGIDTLTYWSTGHSGWRPADRWLRNQYHDINNSVASSNSLFGSMGINGMSVLISLRNDNPKVHVTETHPKVLYYALANNRYNYSDNNHVMDTLLSDFFKTTIVTNNDHEWDAAVSVFAALQGILGEWKTDLHQLPELENEKLIKPCGRTNYWWPH